MTFRCCKWALSDRVPRIAALASQRRLAYSAIRGSDESGGFRFDPTFVVDAGSLPVALVGASIFFELLPWWMATMNPLADFKIFSFGPRQSLHSGFVICLNIRLVDFSIGFA